MWTRTTLAVAAVCIYLVAAAAATTQPQVSRAVAEDVGGDTTAGGEASAGATTVPDNLDVEGRLRALMDRLIHESLPRMTALGTGSNVTGDCSAALFRLLLGMRKFEPWALRCSLPCLRAVLDANSRPPGGLISGTFNDLGTYDQCLSTAARDADGGVHFSGQYCTLYLQPRRLPFFEKIVRRLHDEVNDGAKLDFFRFMYNDMAHGLRLGVCFPSACSAREFQFLIRSLVSQHGFDATVKGCVIKEKTPLNTTEKALMYFMASCISFVIVGSLTDIYLRKYGKEAGHDLNNIGSFFKVVLSFSAVANTEKLLNVQAERGTDAWRLRFLHGLRFLSASWVILGHSYLTIEPTAVGELLRIVRFGKNFIWCLVGNAYPSVQTFLFMSGFLLSFNIATHLRKRRGSLWLPVTLLLIRRYIRLTAPLMFVIGVWLLVPLVVDGPLAKEHHPSIFATCTRNWWRALIHINNWSDLLDMCLQHSWYVSVDWQIYMFIWIIPVVMLSHPRIGLLCAGGLAIGSSAAVTVNAYLYSYQPLPLYGQPQLDKTLDMMKFIYYRPYVHVTSYAVGIMLGYAVSAHVGLKLPRWARAALWTMSTMLALLVVFGPFKWLRGDSWLGADAVVYAGFSKLAWALSLSWVVFACASGRGGFANRLLSWKPLIPLSRLSYGAYLIHSPLYLIRAGIMRERLSLQHFNLVKDFFGCLTMSFLMAYLLYLVCEAPVASLEKLLLAPVTRRIQAANSQKDATSDALHGESGREEVCVTVASAQHYIITESKCRL
ncbi:nose resistant to fluoxetine protein 6-like [Rhipicephalus sanguineus]|uniref:nose resistant to fluoxetine protein 6-like n=1 Tax=Rhipicephalus sanguineus TaxID=34632 RepID=UPI001895C161|nr:nose resistant to fluoxetine protein 6-like [Rhipicephalus sanguineus]